MAMYTHTDPNGTEKLLNLRLVTCIEYQKGNEVVIVRFDNDNVVQLRFGNAADAKMGLSDLHDHGN